MQTQADGNSARWSVDASADRDHDLLASLFGIEAAAMAWSEHASAERDPAAELAAAIASEARRLRAMLQPAPKKLADFDLADAVRPVLVMAHALGVAVEETLPSNVWVHGCRDDTAQVMFALLDNARLHAGTPVDVRVTRRKGVTILHVEDRGPGIPDDGARPVFARGRPGSKSSGSGLGLFIARKLMLEQGGELTYRRRAGGGASFRIKLPTATRARRGAAAQDAHPVFAR